MRKVRPKVGVRGAFGRIPKPCATEGQHEARTEFGLLNGEEPAGPPGEEPEMISMKNAKIGVRLAIGFGVVLVLMVAGIVVGWTRLAEVYGITEKIVQKDWTKSVLANEIMALANDNAKANMELFLVADKGKIAKIQERIDRNKGAITGKIEKLEGRSIWPRGRPSWRRSRKRADLTSRRSRRRPSFSSSRARGRRPPGPWRMKPFRLWTCLSPRSRILATSRARSWRAPGIRLKRSTGPAET